MDISLPEAAQRIGVTPGRLRITIARIGWAKRHRLMFQPTPEGSGYLTEWVACSTCMPLLRVTPAGMEALRSLPSAEFAPASRVNEQHRLIERFLVSSAGRDARVKPTIRWHASPSGPSLPTCPSAQTARASCRASA